MRWKSGGAEARRPGATEPPFAASEPPDQDDEQRGRQRREDRPDPVPAIPARLEVDSRGGEGVVAQGREIEGLELVVEGHVDRHDGTRLGAARDRRGRGDLPAHRAGGRGSVSGACELIDALRRTPPSIWCSEFAVNPPIRHAAVPGPASDSDHTGR